MAEEEERICKEDEIVNKRKELIESMKTRPFWHYCEVCGKKEFITVQDAFDAGLTMLRHGHTLKNPCKCNKIAVS